MRLLMAAAVLLLCCVPTVGGEVTGLTLIDAASNRPVRALKDGDTIDFGKDGRVLNIRADVSGRVGSVRFALDGKTVQTESTAPFALAGDRDGDYDAWQPAPGRHTLIATPYAQPGARGAAGKPFRITLMVVGRSTADQPRPRPAAKAHPAEPVPPAAAMKAGTATTAGELKKWHKVTLSFAGPAASETADLNPFTDYRLNVTFRSGDRTYVVPGYYAADGNAAETGAVSGNVWRVHFRPDRRGPWPWAASFRRGKNVAVADVPDAGESAGYPDGATGTLDIAASDKTGRDHRARGRLQYVGERYLRFADSGEYFLKQGADAPENFLAFADFDGDFKADGHKDNLVKTWEPHVRDWRPGDPTWRGGRGKGMIGAVNYLASEGMNVISFLTLNIDGDDRNVFPYLTYGERLRMDVSRLDQWEIVFDHMDRLGFYLHFKTQETENEILLDNGEVGVERRLYYRELIARFGHHLALNWNLGEENGALGKVNQSTAQRQAMTQYFHDHDPYRHLVVIHNGKMPADLLGDASKLTGFSLQTHKPDFSLVHRQVAEWIRKSEGAGKAWVVACDEPGDASHALRPDDDAGNSHEDGRVNGLWGCLLAGGAGNEWYFGYKHAHSDLTCQDWRSRDKWWDQCRIALEFFHAHLPFWKMACDDGLIAPKDGYCFAQPGEVYVILLRKGGTTTLDLGDSGASYSVQWFDPRKGGALQAGSVKTIRGPGKQAIGTPPSEPTRDWVVLVKRQE